MQEIPESRSAEYEESRRRLGITREMAWLVQTPQGDVAITYIEANDPKQVITNLATSNLPFDRWFREQILELYGLDVTQWGTRFLPEQLFEWRLSSSGCQAKN